MTLEGTVVNGAIVLDGSPPLPDGARVRVELATAHLRDDEPIIPPTGETREEILESLRQSIAETNAGVKGMPLAEFMAELKREYGLPGGSEGRP